MKFIATPLPHLRSTRANHPLMSKLHSALADLCKAVLQAIKECDEASPLARQLAPPAPTPPAPYVTIQLAAAQTGLSEKAIRRKIEDGVWLENREWRRAPDGRLYISVHGYQAWVERGCR